MAKNVVIRDSAHVAHKNKNTSVCIKPLTNHNIYFKFYDVLNTWEHNHYRNSALAVLSTVFNDLMLSSLEVTIYRGDSLTSLRIRRDNVRQPEIILKSSKHKEPEGHDPMSYCS